MIAARLLLALTTTSCLSRRGLDELHAPGEIVDGGDGSTDTGGDIGAYLPPTHVALLGPASAVAGACEEPFSVELRDAFDRPAIDSANRMVTFLGQGSGSLHTESGCVSPASGLLITAGATSVTFYFRDDVAEQLNLAASTVGIQDGQHALDVHSGTPATLSLSGATGARVGDCTRYVVSTSDVFGNTAAVATATSVLLSGQSAGAFFSDAACSTAIGSAVMVAGTSQATFYFSDTTPESLTLVCSATGLADGTQPVTISGNPATMLALTGPSTLATGGCGGPFTIAALDAGGYRAPVSTTVTVNLAGQGGGTFYADSPCSQAISQRQILSGASTQQFYFKDAGVEVLQLQAADASTALGSAAFIVTISDGTAVIGLVRSDCTGLPNCFTTLAAWEAAFGGVTYGACTAGDLVCAGKSAVAQIDGGWATADTTPVTVDGWRTDASHSIRIYTAPAARHHGRWDDTKYRLIGGSADALNIHADYVTVEGLQIENNAIQTEKGAIRFAYVTAANNRLRVSLCILRAQGLPTLNWRDGILLMAPGTSLNAQIWNNLIYDFVGGSNQAAGIDSRGATFQAYNNTIVNCYIGIWADSGVVGATVKNNIVVDSVGGDVRSTDLTAPSDYNLTTDTSAPGAHSKHDTSVTFVDPGNGDYHLAPADTGAKGSGVSLSGDALLSFTDDLELDARGATWDIGADQVTP